MGIIMLAKEKALFLKKKKKKSHILCKKEESYLINCIISTHANEMAQNRSLKPIVRRALNCSQL